MLRTGATGGALVGLGNLFLPSRLLLATADVQPASHLAPVQPEMQCLVRLLEETPRGRVLEEVAARIRQGLSYHEVLRRLLLLQNTAFLPMFREAMRGRGELREAPIDKLETSPLANNGTKAVEEILAAVSRDRTVAVGKTLAYLQGKGSAEDLMDAARRLVLLKGDDPHDYKFSMAAMEDYYHVSPAWRDRYLAASMLRLSGSGDQDNELAQRIRASLDG